MPRRPWVRYSLAFQARVVGEIESGRFASVSAARVHYGINGAATVSRWVRRLGRNHLLGKVVRVESMDERDQLKQLKAEVARLQKALGQTQAENLLNQSYLKLACERLGEPVELFQKKFAGVRSSSPGRRG